MSYSTVVAEIADPASYFQKNFYIESQLISLELNENEGFFELVVRQLWESEEDLWREMPEKPTNPSPSKFHCLKFLGVNHFQSQDRWIRNKEGEIKLESCYANLLIQDLQINSKNGKWHILLNFAWDTKCEFDFSNLLVSCRFGYAKKRQNGEDFEYIDTETNQAFNFYKPFD